MKQEPHIYSFRPNKMYNNKKEGNLHVKPITKCIFPVH